MHACEEVVEECLKQSLYLRGFIPSPVLMMEREADSEMAERDIRRIRYVKRTKKFLRRWYILRDAVREFVGSQLRNIRYCVIIGGVSLSMTKEVYVIRMNGIPPIEEGKDAMERGGDGGNDGEKSKSSGKFARQVVQKLIMCGIFSRGGDPRATQFRVYMSTNRRPSVLPKGWIGRPKLPLRLHKSVRRKGTLQKVPTRVGEHAFFGIVNIDWRGKDANCIPDGSGSGGGGEEVMDHIMSAPSTLEEFEKMLENDADGPVWFEQRPLIKRIR
eukprot:TRINITY_DN1299_c0_g1_i1.p1 TRINITY_DN1299_c0_g1~~TRINITY_DN1299_c0_g1_i1.p1  ORF type:complete len:314 (-),score=101.25 TRINITY_DN1299_c0_g1_i1:44-859(-)